jgi:hypothetical protein
MAKVEANVVLYAADLDDLRGWIGTGDRKRLEEAWSVIRDDPDSDWDPEELEVLHRVLERVVVQGQLYEGLAPDERYYLTQVLIDLFDEYVDQGALSEDMPLDRLLLGVDTLPRGSEAARMAGWLLRGRELNGDNILWSSGPVDDVLSYAGYLTRQEAPRFVAALDAAFKTARSRPSGLLKQLRSTADECARAELDLVSFVG